MNKGLVSIIVPAFNMAAYIEETLLSLVAQTYSNWECLVIDDGSVDGTAAIVQKLEIEDKRIKYYFKTNGGLCSARNFGLLNAKGDFIQFLDGDDILLEDKLEVMMKAIDDGGEQNKNEILFCDFYYGTNDEIRKKQENEHKLFSGYAKGLRISFLNLYSGWDNSITIPIHCFLFPGNLIKGVTFDVNLISKEDWDFHLNILSRGNFFKPLDHVGCVYRVTNNSMSKSYSKLLMSSLLVASRWKPNMRSYMLKVSFYFLQSYIYVLKQKDVSLKYVLTEYKAFERRYWRVLCGSHILMPYVLVKKITGALKIRLR